MNREIIFVQEELQVLAELLFRGQDESLSGIRKALEKLVPEDDLSGTIIRHLLEKLLNLPEDSWEAVSDKALREAVLLV